MHNIVKYALCMLLLGISFSSFSQNVGINTTGATPSTNAILDLNTGNSRNLGFILPHVKLSSLTTFNGPIANAKTTKDTGMLVYNTNAAVGNGAGCYCWSGAEWVYVGYISNKASLQANPANPTGIKNTTMVMMGLGASITPTSSGTVLLIISGYANNSHANDGDVIQIYMGTGTSPANNSALAGTARGSQVTATLQTANTQNVPFSLNAVVTGLTVGVTYWIDLGLASTANTGTAAVAGLSVSAIEQ